MNTTTNLSNRCPSSVNNGSSLEEKYLGVPPKVDNLRIFGSLTYVHVLENEQTKLGSWSTRCMLVGFDSSTKGYRFNLWIRKIVISKDVAIDESIRRLQQIMWLQFVEHGDVSMLPSIEAEINPIGKQDECLGDNQKFLNCCKIKHPL